MVKGSCWPVLSILAMVALMLKYSAWNSRWIRIRGWPTAGARRWGLCWFLSCEFSDSDTGRSAIMRSKAGVPSGCSPLVVWVWGEDVSVSKSRGRNDDSPRQPHYPGVCGCGMINPWVHLVKSLSVWRRCVRVGI